MSLNYPILVLENDLIEVEEFVERTRNSKQKYYINERKAEELKRAIKVVRKASAEEDGSE